MLIFRHASGVCFAATNRKVKLRGRRHESFIGPASKVGGEVETSRYLPRVIVQSAPPSSKQIFRIDRELKNSSENSRIGSRIQREREIGRRGDEAGERAALPRITALPCTLPR